MKDTLLIPSRHHAAHHPPVEYEHDRQIPYRETPTRVEGIQEHLVRTHLVDVWEPERHSIENSLAQVHSSDYLAALATLSSVAADASQYLYPYYFPIRPEIAQTATTPLGLLGQYSFDIGSPVGPNTWEAAQSAARAAWEAANLLLNNDPRLPYALCRPPGHHAGTDFMGGYCYLNNAAVAAAALKPYGRVAIVDVDYHHGNGTQQIFWNDPGVFFLSLHGHPEFEYPHYAGFANETGGPDAPGTNLNLPLPRGTTGPEYLAALSTGLSAIAAFKPQYLVISLGFDTYQHDPWSTFALAIDDYAQIAGTLAALHLPTLLVQEGGYATADLPLLVEAFLHGWHTPATADGTLSA